MTTSMTGPETMPSFSLISSIVPQARSYCAALLREDQPAVLVLLLEDEGLELLVEVDDLVGVDVVADRELARRDDALGLVADVEQDLVAVDLDDLAGDDVAVVELDDRGVDRIGERLAAEVVEDDGRRPSILGGDSVPLRCAGRGVGRRGDGCRRLGAAAVASV